MKKSKGKIGHVIQAISIIPILVFGAIILLLTYWQSINLLKSETVTELEAAAFSVNTAFNSMYPGDYTLEQKDEGLILQKGLIDITREYDLFDTMKEKTGFDFSIYYADTIIVTTLKKSDNERLIGAGATEKIVQEVIENNSPQFYEKVLINRAEYYAYYYPLTNKDGSVVGMLCACKPAQFAVDAVNKTLVPLMLVILLSLFIIALFIFLYTRKFQDVLSKLQDFLGQVSSGNLNAELDPTVSRRNDEFGVIGRNVVSMQDALRHMLEQDALTKLFNRHFGNRKLAQIIKKNEETGSVFALAIGDIDFFKKVNDTYGHDAGDVILKNVATVLRDNMLTNGFVARWGGEEFLLVFDKMNMYQGADELEKILEKIRAMETVYDDQLIKVTMTFGITEGHGQSLTELLREADEKLYNGKEGGRNRIVV